jgi:hypothetical protein
VRQRRYLAEIRPQDQASVVIDNSDPADPRIVGQDTAGMRAGGSSGR